MDKKLTDSEIKKALAQCENQTYCSDCPYYTKIGCKKHLYQDALDLINRREGEKEKNENIIRIADKTIATLDAENESLKAEVERLKRELNLVIENSLSTRFPHCVLCDDTAILTKNLEGYDKFIADIKAEAYKECIEKVKEEMSIWSFDFSYYSDRTEAQKSLDNLWNEFERKENTIYDD